MRQLAFEFMYEWISEKAVLLEEQIEEELIGHMAAAIIEVVSCEGEKTDDGLSEQR